MYQGASTSGANAAAQTGQAGTTTAQAMGNALQSAGAAQAAGITQSANALTGGLSNISNTAMTYSLLNAANTGSGVGQYGTNALSNSALGASVGQAAPMDTGLITGSGQPS